MEVGELIRHLQNLPKKKPVALFWDGAPRGGVEGIINDDLEVVIVGDWSIYRDGVYRGYEESKIIYG